MKDIKTWKTEGFLEFSQGFLGNGGQNIYVSRNGVLQRIFRYDLDNDGWFDLVFVNSQDMDERSEIYVYENPLLDRNKKIELPTLGAYTGALDDLNDDGFDDIIVSNQNDGSTCDLNAFIYMGSPEGLSEKYKLELPAPNSRAAAIGDFNGDGKKDIALATENKLRIYYQNKFGFEPGNFVDIDIDVAYMSSADIDGDGFCDLYIRPIKGKSLILWGSHTGLDLGNISYFSFETEMTTELPSTTPNWKPFGGGWRTKILNIKGKTYLFHPVENQAALFPIISQRIIDEPLLFNCQDCVAAASGDITGDGYEDVVFAVCPERQRDYGEAFAYPHEDHWVNSWIYWGSKNGFQETHRKALKTLSARDIAIADLNKNGFCDIVVCQGSTSSLHTTSSLIYPASCDGISEKPIELETKDATTVMIGKTSGSNIPQVIFVNHTGGRVQGDIPVYIYHGGKNGYSTERRTELPGRSAPDAMACDFNDNGYVDLLVSNCSENSPHKDPGAFIYWGGENGFSAENKIALRTWRAHGSAVGDFRHSGYLDIAIVGFSNPELLIFQQDSNGFDMQNPQRILLDPEMAEYEQDLDRLVGRLNNEYCQPRWIFAADFNNNGWLDLFIPQCAGTKSLILWGSKDGFDIRRSKMLAVEGASCCQVADLNSNGYLDLIIGSYQSLSRKNPFDSSIYIYWNSQEGFSEFRKTQLPANACNSIAIADFNNNGSLDILATNYKNGVERDLNSYIYWGEPGGHYSVTNRTRLFSHSACGCIAADFNQDGWIDIAIACHKTYGKHEGFSQIWWNGPDGFNENRRTYLPTKGPHGMFTVDPGNIRDRSSEEYYTSKPFELPANHAICGIDWHGEVPQKTWVKARFRICDTLENLVNMPWGECWFENHSEIPESKISGKFIQYQLALGAFSGLNTPRIHCVNVYYRKC